MSDLAGGLVPLGSRTGSGTGGSKSTLSGGLIPLGNKSRPTASFDRADHEGEGEDRDGKGSSSSRRRSWDRPEEEEEEGQEEQGSALRKEGSSSGLHPDKKVASVILLVQQATVGVFGPTAASEIYSSRQYRHTTPALYRSI